MSTLVPVMCVWCVVCLVLCVWCGWGGGKGGKKNGVGGIDTDGWVLGPMCCDVPHLGCPEYTAKPMGRLIAKPSLAPSSLGVHPITCDVCVCGVWCVLCCVCGEIHGETYGPNSFEIVVGAFVVWCPPKYL